MYGCGDGGEAEGLGEGEAAARERIEEEQGAAGERGWEVTPTEAGSLTLDQRRDWCAEDDGWLRIDQAERISHDEWWKWTINAAHGGKTWCMHPHPPTLDGAAKAMPEGWTWDRYRGRWSGYKRIYGLLRIVRTPDTGDEIADRYLLAVLCRMAMRGAWK